MIKKLLNKEVKSKTKHVDKFVAFLYLRLFSKKIIVSINVLNDHSFDDKIIDIILEKIETAIIDTFTINKVNLFITKEEEKWGGRKEEDEIIIKNIVVEPKVCCAVCKYNGKKCMRPAKYGNKCGYHRDNK